MDILYSCCAGLDVHKKTVVACVRCVDAEGKPRQQTRTFGTMTQQLLEMADWLSAEGVGHVAMESTGVYWKPIWNLLEGMFEMMLVNAQHIKKVPGRKTDVKDAELTRQRRQLIQTRASVANRIQKVLEDANIKLASVATNVLGVSGRAMLEALVAGQANPDALAELAQRKLRAKIPQLRLALHGRVTEHHRFLLRLLLDELKGLEELIERLSTRIAEVLPVPFGEAIQRLATIPGIDVRAAENILAEIGVRTEQFPSASHLASWTGMSPGNRESAGKRQSGRTTKGNRWLRATLVQVAWAATHTKGTYVASLYRRLAGRRGKKRALVAVAHSTLVSIYHILAKQTVYSELGPNYLDQLQQKRLTHSLVRRLQQLGHEVILKPKDAAA
jgi:transposase